jgi:rubrerythrin
MNQTIKNLAKAFIGESMARNRYTIYAEIAEKENQLVIAEEFLRTANQEKMHAKLNFMLIRKLAEDTNTDLKDFTVDTDVPIDLGKTKENLLAAIAGETHEFTKMYPKFAKTAEEEGYPEIASKFRAIAKAEENHTIRYKELLRTI